MLTIFLHRFSGIPVLKGSISNWWCIVHSRFNLSLSSSFVVGYVIAIHSPKWLLDGEVLVVSFHLRKLCLIWSVSNCICSGGVILLLISCSICRAYLSAFRNDSGISPCKIFSASSVFAACPILFKGGIVKGVPCAWLKCALFRASRNCSINLGS